jgi:hypothetical protein
LLMLLDHKSEIYKYNVNLCARESKIERNVLRACDCCLCCLRFCGWHHGHFNLLLFVPTVQPYDNSSTSYSLIQYLERNVQVPLNYGLNSKSLHADNATINVAVEDSSKISSRCGDVRERIEEWDPTTYKTRTTFQLALIIYQVLLQFTTFFISPLIYDSMLSPVISHKRWRVSIRLQPM